VITLDDEPLAVVSLAKSLGGYAAGAGRASGPASPYVTLVVAGREEQRTAFSVDAVLGEQEVLVKPLGPQLARLRCVSAATVLGDGAVVPILNLPELLAGMDEPGGMAAVPLPEASEEALAERRLSVVVAEDSITSRTLLKSILQAAGHEVVTAVDGAEALAALRGGHFDILVSDVEMPRLNGFELTAAIRADQALRDLPVILVTSLASREDQERGIEAGANAYITKGGFDQTTLLEAIGRLA
jgi:two-component system, chemotaxis family, sensor kinase CheA